jgi:hypothetical protein
LQLNPDSAIVRIQYARAADAGRKRKRRKPSLYQQAARCQVRDATERLDQRAAQQELEEEKLSG